VEACLSEARTISGKFMTLAEVLSIVKRDTLFYQNSGGGVTASGGEPTYQPVFLREFFRQCQDSGLHTTLDTCGYVRWKVLEGILEYVALVLFDIKHMDPARHEELTGVDNRLILENAERIAQKGKPMIIRMPLIPGYNDSSENVRAVAEFMGQTGLRRIDVLPYHKLGVSKYRRLGREYQLSEAETYEEEKAQLIKGLLESYGLEVSIT
jgi:pyruvate formate lyase activating enzyme